MNDKKSYNIGLDIGTSSVGWAVIDDDFNVIRKGNKRTPLWGVRLFDEADTAASRRMFRSTRRRFDRRRERIKLLQDIFSDEIKKVDTDFFDKLKTSNISSSDTINNKVSLTEYDKKEIFSNGIRKMKIIDNDKLIVLDNKYPTIYHLRKELMETNEKMDIRLIYLAMHHMIKYRGNFNYNMDSFNIDKLDVLEKLLEIFDSISLCSVDRKYDELPSKDELKTFEEIILEKSKRDRQKKLEKFFWEYFTKKTSKELANALVGYTFTINNLFGIKLDKDIKLSFDDASFDDKLNEVEDIDDYLEVINLLKELHGMLSLKEIFNEEKSCSLSKLMVKFYDIHKNDLRELKNVVKPFSKQYKLLFKTKPSTKDVKNACIYERYVRNNITYEEWTKEVKNVLENIKNDENSTVIDDINERITIGNYMPRIADTGNGKYPYQINKAEMKMIINNQAKYYPFLSEKLNDGSYKIVKILTFRIPYYVGPLVTKGSDFAWMKRKNNDKITPFNFEEVVDRHESAKKFIYRMLGHCSYLLEEYQIPTNSILYSKFKVLNELKQIKVCDQRLTIGQQHKIYEELFLKQKGNITDTIFKNYLRTWDDFSMYTTQDATTIDVSGYSSDGKFANNMNSYLDFFGQDGIFEGTELKVSDAEEIIKLLTVFEDKNIVREEVENQYPILKDRMTKVLNLKYRGWSGLSEKLLTTPYYADQETGIKQSIMDLMWSTTDNFMQIINNDKYNFQKMIKQENNQQNQTLSYDLVKELATSPANKRGIYQSLKVVDEIVKYMGYNPKYVSVEMARSDDKKQRTDDRKKKLLKLYDENKNEIYNYSYLKKELEEIKEIDNEKLLLYFRQEGKSLYSMTPLDIHHLNQYDVDHILPQSLIKDDSIDNKALVLQEENRAKSANLTVPKAYRDKCNNWWKHLEKIHLISRKKLNNLQRPEFKNESIEGFINRQIVETRQITKHVANIISNLYEGTKVIYLKANISHNYRERFKLYKYRDLNDYHHAHDAYLAIVLGIYQNTYLKSKVNTFELKELVSNLIKEKRYYELRYGYVVNSIDQTFMKVNHETGEVFNIDDFTSKIENTLYRNDILISKKVEFKTGEFYNQTKNSKGMPGVPLKKGYDTALYGSYTSLNPSYAVLIRYTKKGKKEQKLIGIPIYYAVQKDMNQLDGYIKNLLKLSIDDEYEIIKDKIPFYTVINWNGQICSLVGATDKVEVCNAKEFSIEKEKQITWKSALNRLFNGKKFGIDDLSYDNQLTDIIKYVIQKIENEYKLYSNLVSELKSFLSDDSIAMLTLDEKEKTLIELFKLLKFNSKCANFKFLNSNLSNYWGKKNGRIISNPTLIYKSTTGLKESIKKYEFQDSCSN